MIDKLSSLKRMTVVVADTGDINLIEKYKPEDATTNPTLILKAVEMERYRDLVRDAVRWGKGKENDLSKRLKITVERLAVNFGLEILRLVPGRISTEADARLSFDIGGTVECARHLVAMYEAEGVSRNRILIKI